MHIEKYEKGVFASTVPEYGAEIKSSHYGTAGKSKLAADYIAVAELVERGFGADKSQKLKVPLLSKKDKRKLR